MEKSLYNFLKENCLLTQFKQNLVNCESGTVLKQHSNDCFKSVHDISKEDINNLKKRHRSNQYFSMTLAFLWKATIEGHDYWKMVDKKYKEYLKPE